MNPKFLKLVYYVEILELKFKTNFSFKYMLILNLKNWHQFQLKEVEFKNLKLR